MKSLLHAAMVLCGLCGGLWCTVLPAQAQSSALRQVIAAYDTTAVAELFNTIPIGFTFIYTDGTRASTQGWLRGRVRWNALEVSTPQGEISRGRLTFNRDKVWQNHHQVTFKIRTADTVLSCSLPLPHVQTLRFNLYTDSLKRDNPYYLNVEGRFSNGRVLPLDTSMVAFRKKGGGSLAGNVLTVSREDTATRSVEVMCWLKTDPRLQDRTLIPVKIVPDTAALPSEQQLFDRWDTRRKRR
jgi:hypothetical protein